MKKRAIIIILVFVLLVQIVNAQTKATAKGYVSITIINNPPQITSISFSPEIAYQDSIIECNPTIIDEVPDEVKVEYKWYKNSIMLDANTKTISGFEEDDYITCEATPIDVANQKGNTLTKTIQIQKTPLTTKAAMFMMNSLGVKAKTQDTIALQQQGLTAITGYVVSEMNTSVALMPILLFLVLLLVLININLTMRYIIKKKSHF